MNMSRQALKQPGGKVIGYIEPASGQSGKLAGKLPSGKLVGIYDTKKDATYEPSGKLVGYGNMLAVLITNSST